MRKLVLMACSVLLLAVPSAGEAQVQFGPQVSWGSDSDLGVGARVVLGLPQVATGLEAHISGDYFFIDCGPSVDCSWIDINANAVMALPLAPNLNTYVGAGLNIARVSADIDFGPIGGASGSNTEIGINILGGIKFPTGSITPFAEARFTLGGGEQLVLTGGILLGGGAR